MTNPDKVCLKTNLSASKNDPRLLGPRHIEYNSIEGFDSVLDGLRKCNNDIRQIRFNGTIKLHGTNMSVCYNKINGFYVQGRHGLINATHDTFGFGLFATNRTDQFMKFFDFLEKVYSVDTNKFTITIYGEWCGEKIQKGVALMGLTKRFVIFEAKMSPIFSFAESGESSVWLDVSMKNEHGKCIISGEKDNIFNVYDFKTYDVVIDLDNLEQTQRELTMFTSEVDNECPFAKHFGVTGPGEGIVWRHPFERMDSDGTITKGRWIFKTKGEKHRNTKNSVLVPLIVEKSESIEDFVDKVCTENRFDQATKELYHSNSNSKIFGTTPSMKHCYEVMNWIMKDILKEESRAMEISGIETKQLESHVGKKVAMWMRKFIL